MNKLITLITLIPWILYLIYLSKNNIIKLKENNYSLIGIKHILPIKNILFFISFIIFYIIYKKSEQIDLVLALLFTTINLFLCIYSYYENEEYDFNITIENIFTFIAISIVVTIITLISLTIKSILITYIILFTTSILNIILLYVSNKIINIVRRMSNEIKQL